MMLPWVFMALADAYLIGGRRGEGLEAVASGLEFIDRTTCRFNIAELRRLEGELLLLDADDTGAARCFAKAIEMARHQSAKSWELRATTSLARLLAKQDRRDEARAMLAGIYNWFTEGFDNADLKDAKALLNELNE
jgi:predicted ATPase